MAKVLNSDWLTAVQFLFLANSVKTVNSAQKWLIQCNLLTEFSILRGGLVRANQILCFGGAKLVDVIIF